MLNKNGFTLVELLTTILIIGVFTGIAVSSMTNVVDASRFETTFRQLQQIRNALVGETFRLETGLRKQYGYLGDMGGLPTSSQGLSPLFSNPGTGKILPASYHSTWYYESDIGIGYGWRGPYLTAALDADFYRDAWGNLVVYDNPAGGPATLTSYGRDGVVGGTGYDQDIVLSIPNTVMKGNVLGYLAKGNSGLSLEAIPYSDSASDVVIYYPDGKGGLSQQLVTVPIASSGKFSFSNVPLGYAAIKVFRPTFSAPTSGTVGPSLIEINKATAAAVPVDVGGNIYSSAPCENNSEFSVVSNSWGVNAAQKRVNFTLSFPAAYSWSQFYHYQQVGVTISYFTSDSSGTQYRYSTGTGNVRTPGNGAIPVETLYTISPAIAFTPGNHTFQVYYSNSAAWSANQSLYIYKFGCRTLRYGEQ